MFYIVLMCLKELHSEGLAAFYFSVAVHHDELHVEETLYWYCFIPVVDLIQTSMLEVITTANYKTIIKFHLKTAVFHDFQLLYLSSEKSQVVLTHISQSYCSKKIAIKVVQPSHDLFVCVRA